MQATFGAFSASTTLTFNGGSFSSVRATSLLDPRWYHTLDDAGRRPDPRRGRRRVCDRVHRSALVDGGNLTDPINRTTAWTGSLTTRRSFQGAVKLPDGKVLLFGGYVPHPYASDYSIAADSAELYDPATGTFSSTGSLNHARGSASGVLLPDGKVLVVGSSST